MPNSEVFAGKVWWLDSLVFYNDAFRQAHKWFVLVSLNFGITEYIWYVKVRELFCKTRHILVEFVIDLLETAMVSSKLSMLGWTVSGFDRNNSRLMMEMVLISQLSSVPYHVPMGIFRWKFAVFQRIILWRRAATAVATLLGCDLHVVSVATPLNCLQCNWHGLHLRRGDESQPLARIFLFPQRNVVVAAMIEVITPNVPLQSRMSRSTNHLQHLWKTFLCFATFRPPFLSITSHPLANYLVPNPSGRCSPLSFGVPPFSSVFPLLLTIFLHILSFFSNLFPAVPPLSSVFLRRNLP